MDLPPEEPTTAPETVQEPEPAKTPGQVAYEAYFDAVGGRSYDGHALQSWEGLNHQPPVIRNAWEAAAQAVLAYGSSRSEA